MNGPPHQGPLALGNKTTLPTIDDVSTAYPTLEPTDHVPMKLN